MTAAEPTPPPSTTTPSKGKMMSERRLKSLAQRQLEENPKIVPCGRRYNNFARVKSFKLSFVVPNARLSEIEFLRAFDASGYKLCEFDDVDALAWREVDAAEARLRVLRRRDDFVREQRRAARDGSRGGGRKLAAPEEEEVASKDEEEEEEAEESVEVDDGAAVTDDRPEEKSTKEPEDVEDHRDPAGEDEDVVADHAPDANSDDAPPSPNYPAARRIALGAIGFIRLGFNRIRGRGVGPSDDEPREDGAGALPEEDGSPVRKGRRRLDLLAKRYVPKATLLLVLSRLVAMHTIDSPKAVYHCPLSREGLSRDWSDGGGEGCCFSSSYSEAREKFVALGNRLKEQVRGAVGDGEGGVLDLIDVESISYDITRGGDDYPAYLESLVANGVSRDEATSPGSDTMDAILLTLRLPDKDDRGEGGRRERENIDVIHSSGVHGIEGYLGSAVQVRFLRELFLRNEAMLLAAKAEDGKRPPPVGEGVRKVLLVHAVNPHGMRHHRRVNENNVDLNRNVLSDSEWADIRGRDPNLFRYVDMDSTLNPFVPYDANGGLFSWEDAARAGGYAGNEEALQRQDEKVRRSAIGRGDEGSSYRQQCDAAVDCGLADKSPTNAWLGEKLDLMRVIRSVVSAVVTLGYTNAKRGLVSAQYHKPSGVSYGGGAHNRNTWENSILAMQHAIEVFGGFDFGSQDASGEEGEKTLWIDVHTGLGRYGEYSMLRTNRGSHGDSSWASRFASYFDNITGRSDDAAVSSGYDQTRGFVNGDILCPAPRCGSLTQEFGTRPGVAVAVALVLENKGYHDALGRRYSHLTSWAFYPERVSWRRKALRGGVELLHAALEF